jgi:RNA polymerase sigma factor (TIGR02999 family)
MAATVDTTPGGGAGDRSELDQLFASLYDELRHVARWHLRRRPPDQAIDIGALIHEAYLRMADRSPARWMNRARFFAYASLAMRAVLADDVRRCRTAKRGGGAPQFSLYERDIPVEEQTESHLLLAVALERLRFRSERLARTVECSFFRDMTEEETAAALAVSDRTVRRDWLKAKAWLHAELSGSVNGPAGRISPRGTAPPKTASPVVGREAGHDHHQTR